MKRELKIPLVHRREQARFYPTCDGLVDFLDRNFVGKPERLNTRSLDLGCGSNVRNPFKARDTFGVDIRENLSLNVTSADLNFSPIPFSDQHFDFVTAFDFLEHVPRVSLGDRKTRFPFVELMNEIDRVLVGGGLFLSQTPAYPSKQAFQDPTHVNLITEDTLPMYFCEDQRLAKMYGFKGNFRLVAQEWSGAWLLALLEKKP